MIVKRTELKEYLQNQNMRMSSLIIEELDKKVIDLLDSAVNRANKNDRKTVMKYDL